MANFRVWVDALNAHRNGHGSIPYAPRSTVEVYRSIQALGLDTVAFFPFQIDGPDLVDFEIDEVSFRIRDFVAAYKPCLFIWDPKRQGKKGFITDVTRAEQVEERLLSMPATDFSYLLTTQVANPGNGFVGSVISDGKGKVLCETYHRPGVFNQRELSQPTKNLNDFLQLSAIEDELLAADASFLKASEAQELAGVYGHLPGYFEFVKGVMCGKTGIFTIGREPLSTVSFPEEIYDGMLRNARLRLHARLAKDF